MIASKGRFVSEAFPCYPPPGHEIYGGDMTGMKAAERISQASAASVTLDPMLTFDGFIN
jgi:hypothetical protein